MPDMGVSSTPEIPPIIIHHNGVMKLLTSLNPHKAMGPDSIPGRLLKETAKEITPALTILSGPIALCGFKLVKSFMTPLWWIIIGGISGVELTPISGMLLRSSDVKTDEN
jgi:hypothetical protein